MKSKKSYKTDFRKTPKIDLHRHLGGALRLNTIIELAKKNGTSLPSFDPVVLKPLVCMTEGPRSLSNFLKKFEIFLSCVKTRNDIERITAEAIEDASRDNVIYLELRFSPEFLASRNNLPSAEIVESVLEASRQTGQRLNIKVLNIIVITREFGVDSSTRMAKLAKKYAAYGIVGIDLAGDEERFPPQDYVQAFKIAKDAGLGITVHSGEVSNAESVKLAIEKLNPSRIGHGFNIYQNKKVMELVRTKNITLEICLLSNLKIGIITDVRKHPIRRYFDAGINVTLNSDDPLILDTSLSDDYLLAAEELGFSVNELKRMNIMGINSAFCSKEDKDKLSKYFV